MAIEIERKFMVKGDFRPFVKYKRHITQGYLNISGKVITRVRISEGEALLGIKSKLDNGSFAHNEYEYKIPLNDARELIKLSTGSIIEKERHYVETGRHIFEIDVFEGDNEGLIMVEVELDSENETFEKPEWLGEEVTHDPRYYNSSLSANPYSKWNK